LKTSEWQMTFNVTANINVVISNVSLTGN